MNRFAATNAMAKVTNGHSRMKRSTIAVLNGSTSDACSARVSE
jgi:hypothetical protein